MPMMHHANSKQRNTAIKVPDGHALLGASVVANFHVPTHNGTANKAPAIESSHIFSADGTPGTIIIT
jgi:hypothetical protein